MVEYRYGPAGGVNDRLSRVQSIVDVAQPPAAGSVLATYSYLGDGTIVRVEHPEVAGGLTLSYGAASDAGGGYAGLDRLGRVVRQAWTVDGSPVDEYGYTYDRNSNRLTRTNELNAAFSEAYAYDGLNRLIGTTRAGDDYQQWGYDQLGNWATFATDTNADGVIDANDTPQERTANEANEITGITGTGGTPAGSPAYDAAGNMTFDGRQHYRYDAWNRLVAAYADEVAAQPPPAVDLHVPGDLIAVYQYDGRGYRVSKSVARYDDNEDPHAVTGYRRTDYLYNDGWQVLEERLAGNVSPTATPAEAAAAGTPHVQYVWDLRYIDTPVLRFRDMNGDGDFADEGDETLYYTNDANMNVTALVTPADGSVTERYVYDPYGSTTIYDAGWTTPLTFDASARNELTYCGYRYDPATDLFHVRARYYSSTIGVWISRDLLRYVAGTSLYLYLGATPAQATDPLGLEPLNPIEKLKMRMDASWGGAELRKSVVDVTIPLANGKSASAFVAAYSDLYGKATFAGVVMDLAKPETKAGIVFAVRGKEGCARCRWMQTYILQMYHQTADKDGKTSEQELKGWVGLSQQDLKELGAVNLDVTKSAVTPFYGGLSSSSDSESIILDNPRGPGTVTRFAHSADAARYKQGLRTDSTGRRFESVTLSRVVYTFETVLVCKDPAIKAPADYRPVYYARWTLTQSRDADGEWSVDGKIVLLEAKAVTRLPAGMSSASFVTDYFGGTDETGKVTWKPAGTVANVVSTEFWVARPPATSQAE